MYQALADLVLITHCLFIAFVMFGGLLAIWKPRVAPWHLLAMAWGAVVIGFGWVCPLTPLENNLRQLAGQDGYPGGFIDQYLVPLIYPPGLTRGTQILLAVALILGNATVYAVVFKRLRRRR